MEPKKKSFRFPNVFKAIGNFFKKFAVGSWKTKLSYLIMGFGCFAHKQIVRGCVFLLVEVAFIKYMISKGMYYLSMLPTLGINERGQVWDEVNEIYVYTQGDNSMLLLLFGVMTIIFILAFLVVYALNVNNAFRNDELVRAGKEVPKFKDDVAYLKNDGFHYVVMSLPTLTITLFTIIPLIFMILMAFTNYDREHQPPGNLFTWVGLENFRNVLGGNASISHTFFQLFIWTIVWAICATFLNYIFGMILAMLINKKGIKLKGMWRTIFVITIAVPQFVTLLLMSKLLAETGAINNVLQLFGFAKVPFLTDGLTAKITVIVVNLWVGIPYTMLMTSGILMNIPADLYESAKIDGAGPIRQFFSITLPYMLHVTTPYLINTFIGNINNFNVIYLLTGGAPLSLMYYRAGETDLLVTWLYKLTVTEQNYSLASVIGILIFVICATFSLVLFNKSNAVQKEDEFS